MSTHNKIKVAVVGATGYTGLDLVLILSKHPKVSLKYLCATKNLGKKISFFDCKDYFWKEIDLRANWDMNETFNTSQNYPDPPESATVSDVLADPASPAQP